MVWLDPELAWRVVPSGRASRPAVFSDAAIQFCLTKKRMFGLAERLLKLAQLDWNVSNGSTLSLPQKALSVTRTARPSQGGLHLLVDSTGMKMLCEVERKLRKHGDNHRRQWRNVH
jgi:hypothetical protein